METFTYKQTPTRDLKVYSFADKRETRRPGIVFFFGGGWQTGSPEQFFPQCEHFSQLRISAFAADYRIESFDRTSPVTSLEDARSCIRWLRSNAERLALNPEKLVGAGGSAGAHLAAACALVNGFDDPSDDLSMSCAPNYLVLFNPVLNNGPEGYGFARIRNYFPSFSPAHQVRPILPPTLILSGLDDKIATPDLLRKFEAEMKQCGNECNLKLYERAQHGFFNFEPSDNPYYKSTLTEIECFLRQHDLIPDFETKSQAGENL